MNVAVLLCAYNGERFIKQQLESIVSQELQPSVVYVYDWGSIDQTVNIVRSFLSKTNLDFEIVEKDKPIGVAAGFKVGIKDILSSSRNFDYIALCDQDDIWLPSKLLEYKNVIDSNISTDLCFSDVSTTDSDGHILNKSRNHTSPYFTSNLNNLDASVVFANPVVGMTMLVSRRLADIYSSYEFDLEFMHDWSLVLICHLVGLRSHYVDKPLVLYRQHSSNVLGNQSKRSRCSLLFSMPGRINRLIAHYNSIGSKLPNYRKFEHLYYMRVILGLKMLKPVYKSVLLFFLTLDYFKCKLYFSSQSR
ncbi:glycosyltransferase [Vibrio sp. SCSIO 43136]|uniref:glycosyltransferase n=1 Tax=Vibrio sp. SCSIO 43136 TaxID=2819101 RepID=UPI002187AB0E|nr:glycosyltransferase [Vibrio sp. SCSIO 43136]